jgi:hypothetical protein
MKSPDAMLLDAPVLVEGLADGLDIEPLDVEPPVVGLPVDGLDAPDWL